MDRNVRNNVRKSIRRTDIVDTIGKVTLTEYEVIWTNIAISISIHRIPPQNLLTNLLTYRAQTGAKVTSQWRNWFGKHKHTVGKRFRSPDVEYLDIMKFMFCCSISLCFSLY